MRYWPRKTAAERGTNRSIEILDTGVFSDNRYFDVFAEYAKSGTDDILIRIEAVNRGPEIATLHLLPTLWFRNTWSWGRTGEGYWPKPKLSRCDETRILAEHSTARKISARIRSCFRRAVHRQ